jgi:ADP-heptose:LPS heptosyltransferase
MTQEDFNYMKEFMLAQEYITGCEVMSNTTEITHNLDRFRPLFVGHPGNYVDIYAAAFGITDPTVQQLIRTTPWLGVPESQKIEGRDVVINRTARWLPNSLSEQWTRWRTEGLESRAVFVGLPEEHQQFCEVIGWDIPWHLTSNMLELAQVIAGAKLFIGNQSQALALAIGLGTPYYCEARRDLPLERNECYFPNQPNGTYF